MPKWAIVRALAQAAIARKERDYPRARKWLSFARTMRLLGDFGVTAPVALPPHHPILTDQSKAIRQLEKAARHGRNYSMGTGAFFNMLTRRIENGD